MLQKRATRQQTPAHRKRTAICQQRFCTQESKVLVWTSRVFISIAWISSRMMHSTRILWLQWKTTTVSQGYSREKNSFSPSRGAGILERVVLRFCFWKTMAAVSNWSKLQTPSTALQGNVDETRISDQSLTMRQKRQVRDLKLRDWGYCLSQDLCCWHFSTLGETKSL